MRLQGKLKFLYIQYQYSAASCILFYTVLS